MGLTGLQNLFFSDIQGYTGCVAVVFKVFIILSKEELGIEPGLC